MNITDSVKEVRGGKCSSDEILNLGQVSRKEKIFNFKIFDFKIWGSLPKGSVEESVRYLNQHHL